jgi:hypothetical protein
MLFSTVPTLVEFHSDGHQVQKVLTFDAMHVDSWAQMPVMGRESELRNLGKILRGLMS